MSRHALIATGAALLLLGIGLAYFALQVHHGSWRTLNQESKGTVADSSPAPTLEGTNTGSVRSVPPTRRDDRTTEVTSFVVVDAEGGFPIEGAEIRSASLSYDSAAVVLTGADGRAQLPIVVGGRGIVTKVGYFRKAVTIDAANQTDVRIELHAHSTLRLTVVDEVQRPIEGIAVQFSVTSVPPGLLEPSDARDLEVCRAFGVTSANGHCERGDLPRGSGVALWIDGRCVTVELDPRHSLTERVVVCGPFGTVSGSVLFSNHPPEEDTLVSLTSLTGDFGVRTTTTDSNGGFRFERVRAGSIQTQVDECVGSRRTAVVAPGQHVDLGTILMPGRATVSGRLQGHPLSSLAPSLTVNLWQSGARVDSRSPEEDGSFSLNGFVGDALISVTAGGAQGTLLRTACVLPATDVHLDVSANLRVVRVLLDGATDGEDMKVAVFRSSSGESGVRESPLATWSNIRTKDGELLIPAGSEGLLDVEVHVSNERGGRLEGLVPKGLSALGATPPAVMKVGSSKIRICSPNALDTTAEAASPSREISLDRWSGREVLEFSSTDQLVSVRPGRAWASTPRPSGTSGWAGMIDLHVDQESVLKEACEPGGGIRGLVHGSLWAQSPVAVTLSWISGVGYDRTCLNAAGRFEFLGLAAGDYVVAVEGVGLAYVTVIPGRDSEVSFDRVSDSPAALYRGDRRIETIISADVWSLGDSPTSWPVHRIGRVHPLMNQVLLPLGIGSCIVQVEFIDAGRLANALVLADADGLRRAGKIHLGTGRVLRRCSSTADEGTSPYLTAVAGVQLSRFMPRGLRGSTCPDGWIYEDLPDGSIIHFPRSGVDSDCRPAEVLQGNVEIAR